MNEARTYIDKEWYLQTRDGMHGDTVLTHDKDGFYSPEDMKPEERKEDEHSAARWVAGRAMEIVMAADKFCRQWPDGPQVDAAQPDPRVVELEQKIEKLTVALKACTERLSVKYKVSMDLEALRMATEAQEDSPLLFGVQSAVPSDLKSDTRIY